MFYFGYFMIEQTLYPNISLLLSNNPSFVFCAHFVLYLLLEYLEFLIHDSNTVESFIEIR
jgi:hypothetical protein